MEIRYNFPMLNQAADNCGASSRNMTSELDGLKRGLQPMLATWEGDAQAAYYARQAEWESAANDLRDLLGRIVSPVVMGVIYFAVFTPVAFAMRLAGRDALKLRLDRALPSYWVRRDPPGPADDSFKEPY